MLVLTRKKDGRIKIGKDITITVVDVNGSKVKIGVDAPKGVPILRDDAINKEPPTEREFGAMPRSL